MNLLKKYIGDVEQMIDTLTPVRDGWQDAFDAKPEKWQESDKGEKLTLARSALAMGRINSLTSALDSLETVKDDLGEAAQEDE